MAQQKRLAEAETTSLPEAPDFSDPPEPPLKSDVLPPVPLLVRRLCLAVS